MNSFRGQDAVVLVDAGDMFGNAGALTTLEESLEAEYLLRGMAMIGYDVANLGEQEFRFGERFLADQLEVSGVATTSANLYRDADDQPYAARVYTTTAGGITVGVVGLIGDSFGDQVADISGVDGEAVSERTAAAEIDSAVAALGVVEVVVVVAHMPVATARELAQGLSGVDVLVVAHDQTAPAEPERIGSVRLVTTGYDGKWVGRLRMEVVDGEILSDDWSAEVLDDNWKDDPDLAALYQEYLDRRAEAADDLADSIPQEVPPGGSYVGMANCATCHPTQAEFWATTDHAKAFSALVGTKHDWSPQCLQCHTTGMGYLGGFLLPDRTPQLENVQCEMCHGAAQDHEAEPVPGYGVVPTTVCAEKCHTPDRSPGFDLGTALPEVQCPAG